MVRLLPSHSSPPPLSNPLLPRARDCTALRSPARPAPAAPRRFATPQSPPLRVRLVTRVPCCLALCPCALALPLCACAACCELRYGSLWHCLPAAIATATATATVLIYSARHCTSLHRSAPLPQCSESHCPLLAGEYWQVKPGCDKEGCRETLTGMRLPPPPRARVWYV